MCIAALFFVLAAGLATNLTWSAVLKQFTDERQIVFSAASLDDAGAWAFAMTSADLGGANPPGVPQAARWSTSTESGSLLTSFPDGVQVHRFAASDDGQWLLLRSASDPLGTNPARQTQLFLYRTDGGEIRQLTNATAGEPTLELPALSGTANRVVFSSSADLTEQNPSRLPQLFVVNGDGTGLLQLTANTGAAGYEPSISDDGSRIAFVHAGNPTGGNADLSQELFAILADGTDLRQVTSTSGLLGGVFEPMVSGGGSRIVFRAGGPIGGLDTDGGPALVAMDSSGGSLQILVEGEIIAADPPDVTADGATAFYVGTTNALGSNPERREQIFRVNADGSATSQLTAFDDQQWLWHPAVSSGGEWVVFVSDGDPLGLNPSGDGQIYAVRGDGTNLRQLTPNDPAWFGPGQGAPAIAGNASWIVFQAAADYTGGNPGASAELFRVRTDGTGLEQLTDDAMHGAFEPDVSDSGDRIAYHSTADPLGTNPDHNAEVFVLEPGSGTVRQLTFSDGGTSDRARISGDGEWVTFLSSAPFFGPNATGGYEVYRVRVSDAFLERVSGLGAALVGGSFRYRALAVTNFDGSKVAFATSKNLADRTPDGSREVFLADFDAVPALRVGKEGPTVVAWDAEPQAIAYDLIRGDVAALSRDGGTVDLGPVTCVENDSRDLDNVESEDATQPAPGQVFFYLLRGSPGPLVGPGSYGQGSGGRERVAASGDCAG
jgi:Tol biopolymer transport system component